jgi:hypothetical protein
MSIGKNFSTTASADLCLVIPDTDIFVDPVQAVPIALANHVEKNNLQGKMRFNLMVGASVGAETADRWAKLKMLSRIWPYQSGKYVIECPFYTLISVRSGQGEIP